MMVMNAHFHGNRRLSFPTHKLLNPYDPLHVTLVSLSCEKLHHRDRNIPFSVLGAEKNSLIRKKQLNEMNTQK